MEIREKRLRIRVGQSQRPFHQDTKISGSEGGVGGVQESRDTPHLLQRNQAWGRRTLVPGSGAHGLLGKAGVTESGSSVERDSEGSQCY